MKEKRFTDAELERVRSTDLPELLTRLGYQVTRVGRYHSTKEMDSLRIRDRRLWYRYSEQTGGDAITFLQHFCGMGFREAVEFLLAWSGQERAPPQAEAHNENRQMKEEKSFRLPPKNADHRRVFAYLRKRGISPQVIRDFTRSGLLYEDAVHHNCVFVGHNRDGRAVFANLRGTCDQNGANFKQDAAGSDKSVSFRLPCNPADDRLFVFEAPIDLMSYFTLHHAAHLNAVALCGLHDGALQACLRDYPHLKRVVLCLDADGPGRKAAAQLRKKLCGQGYAVAVRLPPHGKDWNDTLRHMQLRRERGR